MKRSRIILLITCVVAVAFALSAAGGQEKAPAKTPEAAPAA